MIRLAVVGGLDNYHGWVFGSIFNGFDPDRWAGRVDLGTWFRIPGAEIVGAWSENADEARTYAEVCRVGRIYDRLEDVPGDVDGVIIPDDMSLEHARWARLFVERGVPVFIDKPLEHRRKEFTDLIRLIRESDAPVLTSSALRFDPAVRALKEELSRSDELICAHATGRDREDSPLVFYGLHTLELVYAVMGCGVVSVRDVGNHDDHVILLAYRDGRYAQLFVSTRIAAFSISAVSKSNRISARIEGQDYYYHMMLSFVEMVRTRKRPVPIEETEELFRVLFALEESLGTGSAVDI